MKFPALGRITSNGRFIREIDGLRFIAIASVVLYHLQWALINRFGASAPDDWAVRFVENGARGVPLFFIISGFILGVPFAAHHLRGRPSVPLKKYFLRRATRLEPPYILNMLLLFTIDVVRHQHTWQVLLPSLGASLLYMHNLIYGTGSLVNGVAWSLEVEIQFYFLVPVLATLFAVRNKFWRRSLIVGLILLGAVAAQLFFTHSSRLERSILTHAQFFLTGFLLADLYLTDWRENPDKHWAWDIVSVVGWPLMFLWHGPIFNVAMPFLSLVLYCAVFKSVVINRILTYPPITIIGGMCYSIYLFHYAVITRVLAHTAPVAVGTNYHWYLFVQFLLVGPVVLACCTIYFLLIERPCMRSDWPQRAWAFLRNPKLWGKPAALVPAGAGLLPGDSAPLAVVPVSVEKENKE
jgi:peptidoglycan/LPS O-acetylase OafA/YrhL